MISFTFRSTRYFRYFIKLTFTITMKLTYSEALQRTPTVHWRQSLHHIPITLLLMALNNSPCNGLVIPSASIFSVTMCSITTSPESVRSLTKNKEVPDCNVTNSRWVWNSVICHYDRALIVLIDYSWGHRVPLFQQKFSRPYDHW